MSGGDSRPPADEPSGATKPSAVAWALFDWATSPFAAVIVTFVFPAYFGRAVVGDEVRGTALWGWMMGLNGLALAFLAPIVGAAVRRGTVRRNWLRGLILVATISTYGLWWVRPEEASIELALWLVAIAIVAIELAFVLVNAMLPEIATGDDLGFWSGMAWGIGYVAGLVGLTAFLYGVLLPSPPPLSLDVATAEPARLAGPIVAAWLLLFSLPLMLARVPRATPAGRSGEQPLSIAGRLRQMLVTLREHPPIARFLLARAIYNEGLNTLFAFGGLFAAGTFGMSIDQVLMFGIVLNLTAGLGASGFGLIEDRLGSVPTLLVALAGLLACGSLAIATMDVSLFWVAGAGLGVFVGPAQAASRTFLARLAPPDQRNELFGVMATTGRVTAFICPTLVSGVTLLLSSQRAGMVVILVLWGTGMALLWPLRSGTERAR